MKNEQKTIDFEIIRDMITTMAQNAIAEGRMTDELTDEIIKIEKRLASALGVDLKTLA